MRARPLVSSALALALLTAVPHSGQAQESGQTIDAAEEYRTCMALAAENPSEALERAGQWAGLGGGVAARHCHATALLELDEPAAAARILEDSAVTGRATAEIKAGLLRQASEAWRRAGQDERAVGVLNAALEVAPVAPQTRAALLEDRAILHAQDGRMWDAVDDLNAALDADPGRVSALVLRAAAYRRLDAADLAAADLDRALEIDPAAVEAYLERGLLAAARGSEDAARDHWMTVLRLAPDSPAADVARAHLEAMDVTPR